MSVGDLNETVSVTADTPIVDPAKIDLGRNMNEREVKNLPLVSRNPFNFALLQPGVTGFENSEFGVPRFSANGTLLRINYQIDGNTNTQKDRAGLRMLPVSEVMVREVKVITSGYAPEFGQTTGLVYNAITPSGTNSVRGSASYRFRRKDMSARPFFLSSAGHARHARRHVHGRHRRADGEGPGPLLRGLREHGARPLGGPRHHDHAGRRRAHRPDGRGELGRHPGRADGPLLHRQGGLPSSIPRTA